jgi:hypothetical protein
MYIIKIKSMNRNNQNRRRFIGTAALTLAAAPFGLLHGAMPPSLNSAAIPLSGNPATSSPNSAATPSPQSAQRTPR